MANAKRAFVFDTNFIIQNKNLKEVIENLNKNNYSVYVTQVAIDERIAQECVKQKGKYEKLAALSNETKEFATITIDKKNQRHIAFYGSEMICNQIAEYLHKELGINKNKVSKTTCYHVWYGGNNLAKNIMEFLYDDCREFYLERKYLKFKQVA